MTSRDWDWTTVAIKFFLSGVIALVVGLFSVGIYQDMTTTKGEGVCGPDGTVDVRIPKTQRERLPELVVELQATCRRVLSAGAAK